MRRFYHYCLFISISALFFSCKPDKKGVPPLQSSQKIIVGTWTMQQEQHTQYVDGVKQKDTVVLATDHNRAYVKFNANGTFSSAGIYNTINPGGPNGSGMITAADSTSGTFNLNGPNISLSEPIAGLLTGSAQVILGASAPPVIIPVSHSASVSQLTAQSLKIHTEYIYTYSVSNSSQTYKMDDDYYYTR
jgi:hypothetical protein